MRTRHIFGLAAALLAAATALGATAGPAQAATSGDTTTTFAITSGPLGITVPASVSLGSGAPGTTVSGQLGTIQVTDSRALLTAAWTSSVTTINFVTGGGTPAETIAKASVSYWSGPATATTGTGTFTPGQANVGAAQAMSSSLTAFSLSAGVGNDSASWNPTLVVAAPAAAVNGTYTGTVTHSVA
jgi:hypothetical protein